MSKIITAAKQAWSVKDQITRNIWLAGLGAYDRGYESATNTISKSQTLFDELVERGRKIESETFSMLDGNKQKISTVRTSASAVIQNKINAAVTNVTNIDPATLDAIIVKIEQLEVALAEASIAKELVDAEQQAAPSLDAPSMAEEKRLEPVVEKSKERKKPITKRTRKTTAKQNKPA